MPNCRDALILHGRGHAFTASLAVAPVLLKDLCEYKEVVTALKGVTPITPFSKLSFILSFNIF